MILEILRDIKELQTKVGSLNIVSNENYHIVEKTNKTIIYLHTFKGEMEYAYKEPFQFKPIISYQDESLKNSLYISKTLTNEKIIIINKNIFVVDGYIILEGI